MKIGVIQNAVAAIAFGVASLAALGTVQAQPLYDRVNVNLPYTVTIGDHTLQPGDYVIQQLPSEAGNSRVVLIYSDNGMKFRTSAMSIPALDPNTARDTKLVLHHFGTDYYLDKIWVQGKDYGYEFPLPDRVKSREKEMSEPVSVAATYSSTSSSENTSTANTTMATTTNNTAANTSTQTDNSANTQTTPPPETSAQTTPPPDTTVQTTPPPDSSTMAQNPTPQPSMQSSADRSLESSGDRSANANDTNAMPRTSAGWLMMLLSGGALSGAGLSLRRKR
jgi:hypothetical protein